MSEILINLSTMGTSNFVLALSGLACIISLFVLMRGYQKTRVLNQKLLRLERELKVANGSAIGMGQQLISMEKKLNQQHDNDYQKNQNEIKERGYLEQNYVQNSYSIENKLTQPKALNNERSVYDQARASLAEGLAVSEVASQCELSFAEVSLLKSLSKGAATSH